MAIVDVVRLRNASATLKFDFQDETANETYRIQLDAVSRDFPGILAAAHAGLFTHNIPVRGARYPHSVYPLYVETYSFTVNETNQLFVDVDVAYTTLKAGESNREDKGTNPLNWPVEYGLSWAEEEYVIDKAYNVQPLGPGGVRQPEFGPVVNGALQEFDEPLVDTRRNAVLHISYNIGSLSEAITINEDYQGTTNSNQFTLAPGVVIQPRRAKFLGAETGGRQNANGVDYYQLTINVAILKTTEREINNVGWNFRDSDGELAPIKVRDEDSQEMVRPSEPLFLKLDGSKAAKNTAPTITYRYLEPVDYSPLLPGIS